MTKFKYIVAGTYNGNVVNMKGANKLETLEKWLKGLDFNALLSPSVDEILKKLIHDNTVHFTSKNKLFAWNIRKADTLMAILDDYSESETIDEDAIFEDGEASPLGAGDISSPSSAVADNSIVSAKGTSDADVLGNWDPAKGFLGKGDFHLPKNVLKNKVLRRKELPSLKKAGLKNPYTKDLDILSEIYDSLTDEQ